MVHWQVVLKFLAGFIKPHTISALERFGGPLATHHLHTPSPHTKPHTISVLERFGGPLAPGITQWYREHANNRQSVVKNMPTASLSRREHANGVTRVVCTRPHGATLAFRA